MLDVRRSFAPAGPDANPADELSYVISFSKEAELFKAHEMFKVFLSFLDGTCRTNRQTPGAVVTTILDGMVVF